ncbi:hypothetical protein M501DRAFT_1013944 [Patellaria atrata CBS 101060]|uniref:Uncharacterized protein n=1 Tax=Patellaria atrata CBS 101060 TaxID=1346257 RepID=A0A9P4SG48_9PEZI|nr:hypothetical protein M501DRAFT_1013944 [Patellaria atrata CBS 101060]
MACINDISPKLPTSPIPTYRLATPPPGQARPPTPEIEEPFEIPLGPRTPLPHEEKPAIPYVVGQTLTVRRHLPDPHFDRPYHNRRVPLDQKTMDSVSHLQLCKINPLLPSVTIE